MSLNWPALSSVGGNLPASDQPAVRQVFDELGSAIEQRLVQAGLQRHQSPLFKPWNLVVARDQTKLTFAFGALGGGFSNLFFIDQMEPPLRDDAAMLWARDEQGWDIVEFGALPLPDDPGLQRAVQVKAEQHVEQVRRRQATARLGDVDHVAHLEPYLREFLKDHPEPERNVFLMMRFAPTPQLAEVHAAIKEALAARGLRCVRADDRDYTGDVWSNIEVYMTGCKYGIAVFEDIDQRDFNPNVSLELGYMMGRQKRCLILKEKRLPQMPADVVHKLYRPWDAFSISATISSEVGRWVDVDLRVVGPYA